MGSSSYLWWIHGSTRRWPAHTVSCAWNESTPGRGVSLLSFYRFCKSVTKSLLLFLFLKKTHLKWIVTWVGGFFLLCEIPNNSITKYVITSLTRNNSIGTLHIFVFSTSKKVMVEMVHQIQKVRGRNESFFFKRRWATVDSLLGNISHIQWKMRNLFQCIPSSQLKEDEE